MRQGLLRALQRQILAAAPADEVEIDGGGEPLGFGIGVGANRCAGENGVWGRPRCRRLELLAVAQHCGDRVVIGEMMREGESGADHGR